MMALAFARVRVVLLSLLLVALLAGGAAWAVHQAGYDLSWWTVDAGGHTASSGGGYSLGGSAGQPDAGVLSDGGYTLAGGFWGGGALAAGRQLYLPLVMRRFP
jgi:hypothetical protein